MTENIVKELNLSDWAEIRMALKYRIIDHENILKHNLSARDKEFHQNKVEKLIILLSKLMEVK